MNDGLGMAGLCSAVCICVTRQSLRHRVPFMMSTFDLTRRAPRAPRIGYPTCRAPRAHRTSPAVCPTLIARVQSHTHAHTLASAYTLTRARTRAHPRTHTRIRTRTRAHPHPRTRSHPHAHAHIHARSRTRAYIDTHMCGVFPAARFTPSR